MPMNLRCMICKCTRRSLSAATDAIGVYHFSGMPLPYKACAVGRVPQNLQLPMALAERRYSQICKHARSAMPLSILAAPLPGSPRRPLASSQRQIRKLLIIFCKNYIKFKKHSANLQHFLAFFLKI